MKICYYVKQRLYNEKIDLKKDLPDEEIVENKFFKVTQKGDVNVKLTKEMKKTGRYLQKLRVTIAYFSMLKKEKKLGKQNII